MFSLIILTVSFLTLNVFAASVTPVRFFGNDVNNFTPPTGFVYIPQLQSSDQAGTKVYKFDSNGQLDPAGTNVLTLTIGKNPGQNFNTLLSWTWSGSYPLDSIIIKGGPAYNLYQYPSNVTSDTNLVAPTLPSGNPANINHISIVLNPQKLPPVPPTPPTPPNVIGIIAILIFVFSLVAALILRNRIRLC